MGIIRGLVVRRFDVWLVDLEPTRGSEIRKTRPCVVISPDAMNRQIRTVILAPMTSSGKAWPSRISCSFQGKSGYIVLDQVRTVDKEWLQKRLGRITSVTGIKVLTRLQEMFAL
ncbi:MAG: type II toxin-antitoxin system PemK/MazF family toxin [Ignavibacteriae bacterium]|nr:type II toxin-antitoxin system PemK/MazF family toxin [Ignavibacteriota bacterium]MCB9214943.1 type II toxin-antitoxin system PemK/MazF family toxin [Ignavibacteria bacterium]